MRFSVVRTHSSCVHGDQCSNGKSSCNDRTVATGDDRRGRCSPLACDDEQHVVPLCDTLVKWSLAVACEWSVCECPVGQFDGSNSLLYSRKMITSRYIVSLNLNLNLKSPCQLIGFCFIRHQRQCSSSSSSSSRCVRIVRDRVYYAT